MTIFIQGPTTKKTREVLVELRLSMIAHLANLNAERLYVARVVNALAKQIQETAT